MNEFREAFRAFAKSGTPNSQIPIQFTFSDDFDTLVIPEQNPNGFPMKLECYDYGVYPTTNGWHSGPWDVTIWHPEKLRASLTEFVTSILLDAILEIRYTNEHPFNWTLIYTFEGNRIRDTTGLLFYNWLGRRATRQFANYTEMTMRCGERLRRR